MMNEYKVHLSDLWEIMSEKLDSGGEIKFSPKGISMLPLIKENRDSVILKKAPEKPNKYDVVLYRRIGGEFVLHRIVKAHTGFYTMCGDNQCSYERNVPKDAILAIMTGLYQGDKFISVTDKDYIKYSKKQVRKQFLRLQYLRIKYHAKKILHIK